MAAIKPFNTDWFAKRVMGFGQQLELSNLAVRTGHLSVISVKKQADGYFVATLNDGSKWKVPPAEFADPVALFKKTLMELSTF